MDLADPRMGGNYAPFVLGSGIPVVPGGDRAGGVPLEVAAHEVDLDVPRRRSSPRGGQPPGGGQLPASVRWASVKVSFCRAAAGLAPANRAARSAEMLPDAAAMADLTRCRS